MLKLEEINYKTVMPNNFIAELEAYPDHDCCLDYETYNSDDSDLAIEPWIENTHPFMFSLSSVVEPEKYNRVFLFNARSLTKEQKEAYRAFLKARRVWTFNSKFEGAVTWKMLGEQIRFDDVQCLYKTDGRFINCLSLKKGTSALLGVPEWAESTWDTLTALKQIVTRVQKVYINKRKSTELLDAFLSGDMRKVFIYVSKTTLAEDELTKTDTAFFDLLRRVRPHLTPKAVLTAITKSDFDPKKVNLTHVPMDIVARYCAYDSYATAINYQTLYESCKEHYPIYLKHSHLSCVMEAYGMTRDIQKEKELEQEYLKESLYYMKKILQIPQFADALGLQIEDKIEIEASTDDDALRKKYWNYNSNGAHEVGQAKLDAFYNTLFQSDVTTGAVAAYNFYRFGTMLEDFTEKDKDGNEVSILKRLKWNTMAEIVPLMVKNVNKNVSESETALRAFLGEEQFQEFLTSENYLYTGNKNDEFQKLSQRFVKWEPAKRKLNAVANESKKPKEITVMDKSKKKLPLNASFSEEHLEMLFSALEICADMSADKQYDEMPWEMQMVFCCKTLKKLNKLLTSYIDGKNGRDRLRDSYPVNDLMEVPIRKGLSKEAPLYQSGYNECSADTKRWKSFVHTIPPGSDIPFLFVPRFDNNILVHYDYSQSEVKVIAAMAGEQNLMKMFEENPKADVHKLNASLVFRKPLSEVSKQERSFCKGACLSGDTRVKLLNGKIKTLKELEGQSDFYVFTVNQKTWEMEPGLVKWVGKVKTAKRYVKITLDDGGIIKMDLNHQLVRKDGVGIMGKNIKVGEVLQSLETGINKNKNIGSYGYEYILNPNGHRNTIYRQVFYHNHRYKRDYHVHHKNCNPFDNTPNNLMYMSKEEHCRHHHRELVEKKAFGNFVVWTPGRRKKISDMMINEAKEWKTSRHYRAYLLNVLRHIRNLLEHGHVEDLSDVYNKYRPYPLMARWETLPSFFDASHEDLVHTAWHIHWEKKDRKPLRKTDVSGSSKQGISQMKRLWKSKSKKSVEFRKMHSVKQRRIMRKLNSDPEINKLQHGNKVLKLLKQAQEFVPAHKLIKNYEKHKKELFDKRLMAVMPTTRTMIKYFGSMENAIKLSKNYTNHTVISVEIVEEKIDLYDMRVPGNNNYWILTSGNKTTKKYSGVIHNNTFSVLYGSTLEGFADQYCDGNMSQAKDIFDRFYSAFPKIKEWIAEQHKQVLKEGYVKTLFGDKIYLPIDKRGKAEALRKAQNYPIQSTSSTLAGMGIQDVWEECQKQGMKAIPQVFTHDSADWDVEVSGLLPFMKTVNICAIKNIKENFGVPMKIDFEMGAKRKYMMGIKNTEFNDDLTSAEIEFECPEIFYQETLDRLRIAYDVDIEIKGEDQILDTWGSMFKPKGVFSIYKNKPIRVFEGKMRLKDKFAL